MVVIYRKDRYLSNASRKFLEMFNQDNTAGIISVTKKNQFTK